jgi:hypothetical protein
MESLWYTLNDKREVVPCTRREATDIFNDDRRVVGQADVGPYNVSTVFLPLDHRWAGGGDPVVFETMIFAREYRSLLCERYTTWADAEKGHVAAIAQAQRWVDGTESPPSDEED